MRPSRHRVVRNVWIAVSATVIVAGIVLVLDSKDPIFLGSMAFAYASLALLSATLLLGPINVLLGRPNPVSTHARRDLGIWGGSLALLHVAMGLQVHLRGSMHLYFLFPQGQGAVRIRYDAFGLSNWIGLVATAIAVVLLASSSDRALRWLGRRRWKALQRANYLLFALVVIHGIVYQMIEDRPVPWLVLVVAVATGVTLMQLAGFQAVRSGKSRSSAPPPP